MSTITHRKAVPTGAHPCGAHPCQADGDIVHGASSQTSGTTLCGLASTVPGTLVDADFTQPTCQTCAQIVLQG